MGDTEMGRRGGGGGEELARAKSGEGKGRQVGGNEEETGRGQWGGGDGEGATLRGASGTTGRGRRRGKRRRHFPDGYDGMSGWTRRSWKCQTSSLIYQATVTCHDNNKDETYIGLTDNTFKTLYNVHTNSLRHEKYRNATALSNYIWMLKDKKISYSLKWKIMDRGRACRPSGKKL